MIRSRPYHPQFQGKVKRSHRKLRKKIKYDSIKLGKKWVNWVANVGAYNRILNDESKLELGWKSPFEIDFGRKSNTLIQASLDKEAEQTDNCITKAPDRKAYKCHSNNIKKRRKGHISPLRD